MTQNSAANLSFGFATAAYAAAEETTESLGPAPVSEAMLRDRLAELGYTEMRKLVCNGAPIGPSPGVAAHPRH